jgi:hypothetical protein
MRRLVCPNTFSLPRYAKEAVDQQRARIDGIVATIVAIGRAMVAREEPQPEYSLFFLR